MGAKRYTRSLKFLTAAIIFVIFFGLTSLLTDAIAVNAAVQSDSIYQQKVVHTPDGIGKFYMGREIAQFMGHRGAGWLERSSREVEEQPQQLIHALDLKPIGDRLRK